VTTAAQLLFWRFLLNSSQVIILMVIARESNACEPLPLSLLELGTPQRPCFPDFASQIHYAEFLFPVTLKCRHIYGVLNVDEIKN
jgi:hypothetical protein